MAERLYRSRTDRVIGGIAGGVARAAGVDATVVRVALVILGFVTQGAAVLLYFVLLSVIPEEPPGLARVAGNEGVADPGAQSAPASSEPRTPEMPSQLPLVLGIALIAIGAWYLVRQLLPPIDLGALWPVIAVALGAVLVVASMAASRRS